MDVSKYLQQFITTHFLGKMHPMAAFSAKSCRFFETLFMHMDRANQEATIMHEPLPSNLKGLPTDLPLCAIKSPTSSALIDDKANSYHALEKCKGVKGNLFSYIPESIQTEIDTMPKYGITYKFNIDKRNYTVHLVSPTNRPAQWKQHINQMYIWLYIANQFAPSKCSQEMTVYLYLTKLQKLRPKSDQRTGHTIRETHANTAFTTSCKTSTELYIFREEEWFKVFIHETFHCMGLDFSEMDNRESTKHILDIFPVKSDVNLFETYCEAWAEIINVLFIAYRAKRSSAANISSTANKSNKALLDRTYLLLDQERTFSMYQCAKILHLFGMEYDDMHNKQKEAAHYSRIYKYKEETNVLSYYILKSIILFYMDDFIQWCIEHNGDTLCFHKTRDNVQQYCAFFKDHFDRPEYVQSLLVMEKWFCCRKGGPIAGSFELDTMRMTIHG